MREFEPAAVAGLIRAVRKRKNLTQEQLAQLLGTSFATVNRWEGGANSPQKAAMEAILALAAEENIVLGEATSEDVDSGATGRRGRSRIANAASSPLDRMLWEAAKLIRAENDEAKHWFFLPTLLLLKRLCDVFDDEITRLAEDRGDHAAALAIAESDHSVLRYYIPPEARWNAISGQESFHWPHNKAPKDIGEHLAWAVRGVVKHNPKLSGVIDVVDFAAEHQGKRDVSPSKLRGVVDLFSDAKFRLGLADIQPDTLGSAYQHLLWKFAETSREGVGEYFTPADVGYLMAHIMRPRPGEECHDYACGSAGLLVRLQLVARELDPMSKVPLKLTGQELSSESYSIAKMNGILHDMEIELARGDTLIDPEFRTPDGGLKKFSVVVAEPPWGLPTKPDMFKNDPFDRFNGTGGEVVGNCDWAWLQHTYACLNEGGRAAVALPLAALLRGTGSSNASAEQSICKWFVDHDLIDGVILLPVNLFYNSSISGVIIVLNKRKTAARKGMVVLHDARKAALKGQLKNYIPHDIIRTLATHFLSGDLIDGEIAVISNEDIIAAEYNLNPAHWVRRSWVTAFQSIKSIIAELEHSQDIERRANDTLLLTLRSVPAASTPLGSNTSSTDNEQVASLAKPLSDIVESLTYGGTKMATGKNVGPRMLRIGDVKDGHVDWESLPYYDIDQQDAEDKRLMNGDIVIARVGSSIGKSYFVSDCPPAVFSSQLIRIRAATDRILPRYLYYALQSQDYWDHINQYRSAGQSGGITIGDLEAYNVNVPSLFKQHHVISVLDAVEARKASLEKAQQTVVTASQALLHHLLMPHM